MCVFPFFRFCVFLEDVFFEVEDVPAEYVSGGNVGMDYERLFGRECSKVSAMLSAFSAFLRCEETLLA